MREANKITWCELCKLSARVYCAADEASLCWKCDTGVHGANFLVARHLRSRLCHSCGIPTECLEGGFHIDPKVTLCHQCYFEAKCRGDLDRDHEEGNIAPSACSFSSYDSCSSSEGCSSSVGVHACAGARALAVKDAIGRSGRSVSSCDTDRCGSTGSFPQTTQSLEMLKRWGDRDAGTKKVSEPCDKEAWSAAGSSGIETEGEASCESNEIKISSKEAHRICEPKSKRKRDENCTSRKNTCEVGGLHRALPPGRKKKKKKKSKIYSLLN